MVKGVFKAVYREVRGLHQAAYVLALFTLGSQVLALVRDRMLAHQFGAGIELDLYYAAFRIPDLLYVLFASTLSVYVLIPFIAEKIEAKSSEKSRNVFSQIFSLFIVAYTVLALLVALFAPYLVPHVFPGFEAYEGELVLLLRILLLQPFLLGISSLFGVITQLGHRFVLYALSPLIYNIGIIFGLIVLYPSLGLQGLVIGVVCGAFGHMVIQLPFVLQSELAPRITTHFAWKEIGTILRVSVPRALTLSLHQIVLLSLVGFATIMTEGSVSVFQFAFNLQSVPLAIIGVSYSVAAFPLLAQLHAEGKMEYFRNHITTALRHIIFWSVPALILLIIIRAQFVRVILGTGQFDWGDTRLTAAVLAIFAISLTFQAVHLLLVRALYAIGNTRLPFYVTLASSLSVFVFAWWFVRLFGSSENFRSFLESSLRVAHVPGSEVLVLPLAYSVALFLHSVVLLLLARRQLLLSLRAILKNVRESAIAGFIGGACAYATLNFFVPGLKTETLIGIFLQGVLAGGAGMVGIFLAYRLQESAELREVLASFHRKIFKTDIVAPQDDDHLAV